MRYVYTGMHVHVCVYVFCVFSFSVQCSELVVGAQQQGLLIVGPGADIAMATREGRPPRLLQRGLLGVLLVGRGEVVDGVLHHVPWVHGLLQTAGDTLHGGAAACRRGRVSVIQYEGEGGSEGCQHTSTYHVPLQFTPLP